MELRGNEYARSSLVSSGRRTASGITARIPMNRPAADYTPRLVPNRGGAFGPLEATRGRDSQTSDIQGTGGRVMLFIAPKQVKPIS
jgi:hypothetical protein